jgi:peptidoglycan/LPS O-acetylase OafA/YrhL
MRFSLPGTGATSQSRPSGSAPTRILALDGLRALAVLLVIADHATTNFAGGGVGVCVFFVLSGFLITGVLAREQERNGRLSLRMFYGRRMLRLYPALIVMLAVTVPLGGSAKYAAVAATYMTDLFNTFRSTSLGAYQHTWSLSLEEHFYLLFPLVLPLALRYRRRAPTVFLVAALASFLAAWFGAKAMAANGGHVTAAVFDPLWQAHGLLIGCALALAMLGGKFVVRRTGWWVSLGAVGVLVIAVLASVTVSRNWAAGWNLLSEIAAAAIIVAMAYGPKPTGLARIFESRVAVWIGERSYALYLWHLPLITILVSDGLSRTRAAAIGVPLAFLAAEISHRWVEAPFLRIKENMHPAAAATRGRTGGGEVPLSDAPATYLEVS